jgi:hypothetical protein
MHIHTQTTTGAHHTRIFAGEEWKREIEARKRENDENEARKRENDKLKASLAPLSRKDLVKRVAEMLQLVEHPDSQKQENYNLIASLAPMSRRDLIERVVEVLDTQRYSENKQDIARYLRDELYAKRKDEGSGDEISDARRTGGEVVEHGCASMKLKEEDLQAVKDALKQAVKEEVQQATMEALKQAVNDELKQAGSLARPNVGTVGGVEKSWLKELGLEERAKYVQKMLIQLDLADKYLQMLESEDIDVRTLLETLEVGGRPALLQLLEDAGVDKAGARARIANYVQQSVDKHS